MSDDKAGEVTPCATCGGTRRVRSIDYPPEQRPQPRARDGSRWSWWMACPDCGEVETPEAAVEATTTAMRVERHRHDRYALSPMPGPYTIECKCGQAFVITPGSLTLYEQWCHHVEARVLSSVIAQGWTPPGTDFGRERRNR